MIEPLRVRSCYVRVHFHTRICKLLRVCGIACGPTTRVARRESDLHAGSNRCRTPLVQKFHLWLRKKCLGRQDSQPGNFALLQAIEKVNKSFSPNIPVRQSCTTIRYDSPEGFWRTCGKYFRIAAARAGSLSAWPRDPIAEMPCEVKSADGDGVAVRNMMSAELR